MLKAERRGSPINPAVRLQYIEGLIRSWNFRRLLLWMQHHSGRLNTREELLVCYVRERLEAREDWLCSMARLRQRLFRDQIEHLAYRALSLQHLKDLRLVASELTLIPRTSEDLLLQVAIVRVADRMASLGQWREASDLYSTLHTQSSQNEWHNLTILKSIVLAYLNGLLENESTIACLKSHLYRTKATPLARAYFAAFHLYIASISARWLEQIRQQKLFRETLLHISSSDEQAQLLMVANYLLHPEQGLGAALWRSQLPNSSQLVQFRYRHTPEMLWLDHCIKSLEHIQLASDQLSVPSLQKAIVEQESLGNGLLAACARSRLLGILLHGKNLNTNEKLRQIWHNELSLLQAMPYSELKSFGALLEAANLYRTGHFTECLNCLRTAKRLSQDRLRRRVIALWLANARGRMPHHLSTELSTVSSQLLNYLFAPTLRSLGNSRYTISEIYSVDLAQSPVLNRLLQQILRHPQKALPTHAVQDLVWGQSSLMEGWKQKLRNAVSRLRWQFRYSLSPLVIQSQGNLCLNLESIMFEPGTSLIKSERSQDILRALQKGPLSSRALVEITRIPPSTMRRYMRYLQLEGEVTIEPSETHSKYRLRVPAIDL